MRRLGPPSEIGRLAAPMSPSARRGVAADALVGRRHGVLYALSGITIVKSDEVAVILRWGRLVGETPALQEHGPGLLFAFPRPDGPGGARAGEARMGGSGEHSRSELTRTSDERSRLTRHTLDPLTQGYAVTGDQNIVQVDMVARYRVRDPAEWAFYGPKAEDVLRVEVTAAMVRSLGEMGVDRVLSDGRKNLIATATRRAQAGLDAAHSGLELASLELTRLAPPQALASDFDAVQSAYIGAETTKKDAQAFAESAIPQAQAKADAAVQTARAAARLRSRRRPRGDAEAFHGARTGISGQPGGGSRAPLPGCRGTGHRARPARFGGYRRRSAAATTGSASRLRHRAAAGPLDQRPSQAPAGG